MPQYTVPKFIELEAKIAGPFTFKQFILMAIAGGICFILYFAIGKANFFLFILIAIILIGGALALAFIKIDGRSLPAIIQNIFFFFTSSKFYLWKRKTASPTLIQKEKVKPEEKEKVPSPKIAGGSRLKKLSTQIETKTR